MQPEALLAAIGPPQGPLGAAAPPVAGGPTTPRTAKQAKRDFRRDRRRRRRISERLVADPTLTDCTKTVALAALRYSDDSAKPVYPSVGALAQAASCQRRSARRCLVDLVEAGYVRRIQRPMAARRNATNLYYFCEPPGPPPAHRQGQRRRPRTRTPAPPTDAQNPSSARRTPGTGEPAKQVPNPAATEPSAFALSASRAKTTATTSARPPSELPTPPEPPQPNLSLAHTHLRAARDVLRQYQQPRRHR